MGENPHIRNRYVCCVRKERTILEKFDPRGEFINFRILHNTGCWFSVCYTTFDVIEKVSNVFERNSVASRKPGKLGGGGVN